MHIFIELGMHVCARAHISVSVCVSQRNNVVEIAISRVVTRVHQTGGNRSGLTGYRSNRSGPVPVWAGTKPAQIQNLNLNLNSKK